MVRNLNSKSQCTPELPVKFEVAAEHQGRFEQYHATAGHEVWKLLLQLVQGDFDTAEEIEAGLYAGQAIAQPVPADDGRHGTMRVLEGLATVAANGDETAVVLLSLAIPGAGDYWFWTTRSARPSIEDMKTAGHIILTHDFSRSVADQLQHSQQYMAMWTAFDYLTRIPDSEEYKTALTYAAKHGGYTDALPNAMEIISGDRYLRNRAVKRSLADDRYADQLEDWEIYLVERMGILAATYIEVKSRLFDKFEEMVKAQRGAEPTLANGAIAEHRRTDALQRITSWAWTERRIMARGLTLAGVLDESDVPK